MAWASRCVQARGSGKEVRGVARQNVTRIEKFVAAAEIAYESAGLTHDELPRRGVDGPDAPQRDHGVKSGRSDLAQGRGDRSDRPEPVGDLGQRIDRPRDPPGVCGFDAEDLEPAVAPPPLRQAGVEPVAV